jgi:hypothetical protein
MVLVGLAALVLAGRLVHTTPSTGHPATSAAGTIPLGGVLVVLGLSGPRPGELAPVGG